MNTRLSEIHRILVIKLRAIGDVLLSTVVLRNLRSAFPAACIDFLTERASREVVEGNPALDNVIVFDAQAQSGLGLIRSIRGRRYDLVIDLFGNPRSAIVTLLSGARYRVGYRFGWRRYCYNIVAEPRGSEMHNRDFNLDALPLIGVPVIDRSLLFPIDRDAEELAQRFLQDSGLDGKFVVAVNPGGGWYTKRWRIPQYARLGDRLVSQFGASVIICWGPGELQDAQELQHLMIHSAVIIPQGNLRHLAAILRKCSAMVTNDSGPMHIAATVNTPVVAIFGPTNPNLQGPLGERQVVVRNDRLDCLGCNLTKCPIGNPCMVELSVDDVISAFNLLRLDTPRSQSV